MTSIIIIIIGLLIFFPRLRFWSSWEFGGVPNAIKRWQLSQQIASEQKAMATQAEYLIQQAKSEVKQDSYNPFEIDRLLAAIAHYKRSFQLVNKDSCRQAIDNLESEIERRQTFQTLFKTGIEYFQEQRLSEALADLQAAKVLYSTPELLEVIFDVERKQVKETAYLQSLDRAKELSYAGKFRDALAVVTSAVAQFTREDGEILQFKLSRVVAAKEQLTAGKIEQKLGDITTAKAHYLGALTLMPEWSEPKLQLAIISTKSQLFDEGIGRLSTVNLPRAKCLEGLLYAHKQEYQKAREIWSQVDRDLVQEYGKLVKSVVKERQRIVRPQIEQLVLSRDLDRAKAISLEFLNKFGRDPLITTNLTNCILPGIETKIWKLDDWIEINKFARENWLEQSTVASLHNYAVSLYYSNHLTDNTEELILIWATAIANIELDPTLKDLPWMGTKSLSIVDIRTKLWKLLELVIDRAKELDLGRYLSLRDLYRQEFWAMELAQAEPDANIQINGLTISPGCYQRYYAPILFTDESQIWQTLYTKWGTAVAACLAGDPARAEIIQANLGSANSPLEQFAENFILYERGCDRLQQGDWHNATYPLNRAKTTIQDNFEWWLKIDELCTTQRRKIEEVPEHLSFAQFWYDLLLSPRSETYLVEYRAVKIHLDWYETAINDELSLIKIKDLLDAYPEHPVVQDTFTQIYDYWLKNNATGN